MVSSVTLLLTCLSFILWFPCVGFVLLLKILQQSPRVNKGRALVSFNFHRVSFCFSFPIPCSNPNRIFAPLRNIKLYFDYFANTSFDVSRGPHSVVVIGSSLDPASRGYLFPFESTF